MATDGTDIDYASRYAEQLVPSRGGGTWQDREQNISREIAAGPDETVAGFAWHFNDRYTRNIASLIASGDLAQAKRYYDDVVSAIEANRDHLLSISQVSDTGNVADELARRANGVLMGAFNQQEVTMSDGSKVTIGQALADGSPYMADRSEELKRLNFSDGAAQLYLANDRNIKAIMDPFLRSAQGGGGVDQMPNRIQMQELAEAYAGDAERINGVFGDGTSRFLDYVRESHRTSGNAAATMRTLVDFADVYSRSTGTTGAQLASDVVNGYNDLVTAMFAGDQKPGTQGQPVQVTDAQRRTFDAAFLPAVREAMARTGGSFDMHDPRLRQSMLEIMDAVAYTSSLGSGGDLFASMRGAGRGINQMFGAYVAEAMTGQVHTPDNIVTAVRTVKSQLGARLTGGRDYAMVASSLTGQSKDYLASIDKVNGTKSTCPEADGIAAEAHMFLAREMLTGLANGKLPGSAFDLLTADPSTVQGLAARIAPSFHGRGREEIAGLLARNIVSALASGLRVNVEEAIGELCFGSASQGLSPAALKTARAWYHGNVASKLQFSDQKTALLEKYRAEGYTDAQARRGVAMVSEQASREIDSGGDPMSTFARAVNVGTYLTEVPVVDDGGKPVVDPVTKQPMTRVVTRVGPRDKADVVSGQDKAPAGSFVSDRVSWDALQMRLLEAQKRQEAAEDFERRRRIAQEVKGQTEQF